MTNLLTFQEMIRDNQAAIRAWHSHDTIKEPEQQVISQLSAGPVAVVEIHKQAGEEYDPLKLLNLIKVSCEAAYQLGRTKPHKPIDWVVKE